MTVSPLVGDCKIYGMGSHSWHMEDDHCGALIVTALQLPPVLELLLVFMVQAIYLIRAPSIHDETQLQGHVQGQLCRLLIPLA